MADATIAQRFVGAFGGHDIWASADRRVRGMMVETHVVTLRDGRIAEQWVGDNSFQMPYMDLVQWQMDSPAHSPSQAGDHRGRD